MSDLIQSFQKVSDSFSGSTHAYLQIEGQQVSCLTAKSTEAGKTIKKASIDTIITYLFQQIDREKESSEKAAAPLSSLGQNSSN